MGQPDGAGPLPLCGAVIDHRFHGLYQNHRMKGVGETELAPCNGRVVRDWNVREKQGHEAPVRAVSTSQATKRLEIWMWSELEVWVKEELVRLGS